MTFTLEDIAAIVSSQPWWVWPVGFAVVWFGMKWLIGATRAYADRPIMSDHGFRQRRVSVDYRKGTITLPRGDTYPVHSVRGLRWEDYPRSGRYRAIIDVDNLKRPIHPVSFSTPAGPEAVVARLRTAIEKAGGPRFAVAASEEIDIIERDLSDPVMAAVATRVASQGRRVSYARHDRVLVPSK